ncbi:hypothetical protein STENM36S_08095 [Streptomyces tendae]
MAWPKTPQWRGLADEIAREIAAGTAGYRPGDQLPQIRDLVAQGKGSKTTVLAAYKALDNWLSPASLCIRGSTPSEGSGMDRRYLASEDTALLNGP